MVDITIMQDIRTVAAELEVDAAALAAVADIESGLAAHAMIDGRAEPLIRFEGHYFDRRLAGAEQRRARQQGLASPQAGAVKNPASQASRWRLLAAAAAINRKAAYESTSWGMGQVMGAHWAWLDYASVDALVADARSGALAQLRLMALYIKKAGLADALRKHDWVAFARGYNGPGYAANHYDSRLARAFARHRGDSSKIGGAPSTTTGLLRRGSRGENVRALQAALIANGHVLVADGMFGPLTDKAVRVFQKRSHLVVDGIVGPATVAALNGNKQGGFITWLLSLLTRIAAAKGSA